MGGANYPGGGGVGAPKRGANYELLGGGPGLELELRRDWSLGSGTKGYAVLMTARLENPFPQW